MKEITEYDLHTLNKEQLELAAMKINLEKIHNDIIAKQKEFELEREKWAAEREQREAERVQREKEWELTKEKWALERKKLEKENFWYPMLPLLTAGSTGGIIVYILTQLAK